MIDFNDTNKGRKVKYLYNNHVSTPLSEWHDGILYGIIDGTTISESSGLIPYSYYSIEDIKTHELKSLSATEYKIKFI